MTKVVRMKALFAAIAVILIFGVSTSLFVAYADKPASYDMNDKGLTYGNGNQISVIGYEPDLILAEGRNGTLGYVYASDLNGEFEPRTPEEAIEWQNEHIGEDRVIPLYDIDGETVVGEFIVTGYRPEYVHPIIE